MKVEMKVEMKVDTEVEIEKSSGSEMESILVESRCSLGVPVYVDDNSQQPYGILCCTNLDWSWKVNENASKFTSLSLSELKEYDFFDTLNNPPEVQALLFLQLVAEHVTTAVKRILERHRLEFELSRQPTPTLGRYSPSIEKGIHSQKTNACVFATNADVSKLSNHPLMKQQGQLPGNLKPPSLEDTTKETGGDACSGDVNPLTHAWCPTWWEYLESCRRTLHADQLILLTRPMNLIDLPTEKTESLPPPFFLNIVSADKEIEVKDDKTESMQMWYEIVSPNDCHSVQYSALNVPTSSYIPFYIEKNTGLNIWSEAVRPLSAPVTSRGCSRGDALRIEMGDNTTGVIEGGDVLRTKVMLRESVETDTSACNNVPQPLFYHRYYYKLDLSDAFPTCLAMVSRVGGEYLAKEELAYFRSVIDVVAGNLRLALLTNACRDRAACLRQALSIPATLVDVEDGYDTPRDRLCLMLRKTCEVVGCKSARLALLNPAWEEMQIVAGWPVLSVSEMGTFPEYKHVGKPILMNDGMMLRTSIVGRDDVVLGVLDLYAFAEKEKKNNKLDISIEFVQNGIAKWFEFLLEKLALENALEEATREAGEGTDQGDPISFHGVHALEALEREWDDSEMINHQRLFQSRLIGMLKIEV